MSTYLWPSLLHNVNIYIYIYILLFFLHICPLWIPLINTAVLIKICRFWINLVKFTQTLTKLDLPTLRKCQIFYLLRCFLSSMLPLRSVGRSNFLRGCVNLTTLIQNTTYFNENCCIIYIFIYMFVNMNIFLGISICHYVSLCRYACMWAHVLFIRWVKEYRFMCLYKYICVCMCCSCIYVYVYVSVWAYLYAYIYICMRNYIVISIWVYALQLLT